MKWKAWQRGALVVEVNEAYTSKTCSWDGSVEKNLGGRAVIRDEDGFGMDRGHKWRSRDLPAGFGR